MIKPFLSLKMLFKDAMFLSKAIMMHFTVYWNSQKKNAVPQHSSPTGKTSL